jgi:hypothetical protein
LVAVAGNFANASAYAVNASANFFDVYRRSARVIASSVEAGAVVEPSLVIAVAASALSADSGAKK